MQYRKSQEAIDRLRAEQRRLTQEAGTERPFTGEYHDQREPGIYADIVSGQPLFASSAKFESGCGWSSSNKPIVSANINELRDASHGMIRPRLDQPTATATSATSSRMGPLIAVACATASISRRSGSSIATTWRARVTANISIRLRTFNMHQRAVLAGACFWGMQDLIGKVSGVVSTPLGYSRENPASYKSPCRDVSPSLSANDELLDYIETPKRRELYLAWCGENGLKPIAIGAAA